MEIISDIYYLGEVVTSIQSTKRLYTMSNLTIDQIQNLMTEQFTNGLQSETKPFPQGILATTHHMGVVSCLFSSAAEAAASIDEEDRKAGNVTIAINDFVVKIDLTLPTKELIEKGGLTTYDANQIVGEAMCKAMQTVKGVEQLSTRDFHRKASALWLA